MIHAMTEQEFTRLADAELAALEVAVEHSGAQVDLELKPGGILELECDDGSKLIINRHTAAREIWLAARAGGFHFAWSGSDWRSGRDGSELWDTIGRCLSEQTGATARLTRP